MTELAFLTATEALARIHAGSLKAGDYIAACLDQIAAREGVVQAFASFNDSHVRNAALVSGLISGMPIGVKDVLDTQDLPSEYGSPIWQGHRPRADAACVAWARRHGGVVMGKTVTTEFATRKPGATSNPHNAAHTPGGSSSGSAAGVAAGFFPFAFGTQTAGSIIRPAAYCGVVGYKPSYGMIPRLGMKVMSESLDTIGTMARSVADCVLLANAAGGGDLGDVTAPPGRAPRIGLCPGPASATATPETRALLERVARKLEAAGAVLVDRPLPQTFAAFDTLHPLVMQGESAQSMGWELAHHAAQISDGLREKLLWGIDQGAEALDHAQAEMIWLQGVFGEWMQEIDFLLTPSAQGEAPEGLDWTGDPMFNGVWTALHVPCVTVPAGTGPKGLPLGVQIVGARGRDRATLAWAEHVMRHGLD